MFRRLSSLLFLVACADGAKPVGETDTPDADDSAGGGVDGDGDGSPAGVDCDDADATAYPGAAEVCDGDDEDCDGEVDEGYAGVVWYTDADGDRYGDPDAPTPEACFPPDDGVEDATDCDDADPLTYPGAAEVCRDGVDQDCDGGDECSLADADYQFIGNYGVGESVALGDVDGDGLADLLIGHPRYYPDWEGGWYPGKTYIFRGSELGPGGSYGVEEADWTVEGTEDPSGSGRSVAFVPDMDGDGRDEVAIAAPGWGPEGAEASVYLFLGGRFAEAGTLSVGDADHRLDGSYWGAIVHGADIEGDGVGDLVVDMAYHSYVVLGANIGAWTGQISDSDVRLDDPAGGIRDAVPVGDVDGDGLDELVLVDQGNAENGFAAGKVWAYTGALLAESTVLTLDDADWSLIGEAGDGVGDGLGSAVAAGGDVDGDGLGDLVVGAYYRSSNDVFSGAALLFRGGTLRDVRPTRASQADVVILGEQYYEQLGSAVASAGDTDGDGTSDLLLGTGNSAYEIGRACLFHGSRLGSPATFSLSEADLCMWGDQFAIHAGHSVAGGADVDGDSLDDLLIGAPFGQGFEGDAKAYLVFGE